MEVTEEDGEGKEGWIKISEEKFPDGLMNRKSAGDMLERLLAAANVGFPSSSPCFTGGCSHRAF